MNALFTITRRLSSKLPQCFTITNQDIHSTKTFKCTQIVNQYNGIKTPFSLPGIILPCGYPASVRESSTINRLFYLRETRRVNKLPDITPVFPIYAIIIHCTERVLFNSGQITQPHKYSQRHYHGC